MATSTLIQKLDSTAFESSKTVPGSYTAVSTPDVSNRRQVETFIVGKGGTVVVGDAVALDTVTAGLSVDQISLFVLPANATTLLNTVGVVLGSAESDGSLTEGSKINVCIRGICLAKVAGAPAAGTVVRSSGAAGTLAAAVAGDAESYTLTGRTITVVTAGFAQVFVHSQFN